MTLEATTNRKIHALFKLHGEYILPYRPVPGQYGGRFIDFVVCTYGWYTVIEAKRPGAKPTPHQKVTLERAYAAGGAAMFINGDPGANSDFSWLRAWLEVAAHAYRHNYRPVVPAPNWR